MPQRPASAAIPIASDGRDSSLDQIRDRVMDLIGPTYILDPTYHFLDWNPTFEVLIAKPLRLARGQHAEAFVQALSTVDPLGSRSTKELSRGLPLEVEMRVLQLNCAEFGAISFRTIAAQISDDKGNILGWSVHLIIVSADEDAKLWAAVRQRLEEEVTWSKYAMVYDSLLLNFTDYIELLDLVAAQVAGAQTCVDLGAGTGNSSLALLARDPTRSVWAVESNEVMIRALRKKRGSGYINRLHITKDDIHNMPGFSDEFFDAATMVNTLYAIDDPPSCLREVNRILKHDGILALSTPHTQTDVDRLFQRMKDVLAQKGMLDSLAEALAVARERHKVMDSQIHRFRIEDVHNLLTSSGFAVEHSQSEYAAAVIVIKARKMFAI